MQLRCLAGRYAGELRDYSTVAGLAALRTGTARRLDEARELVDELHAHQTPAVVDAMQHTVDHALTAPIGRRPKIRRA